MDGVAKYTKSPQQKPTSKPKTQEKRATLKTMKVKHQRSSSLSVDMTKVTMAEKPTWNDKHQGKVDTFLNLLRTATDLGALVKGLYDLRRGTKGVEPQTKVALQQGAQKFSPEEKRDAPQKVEWIKGQIKDGIQLEYLGAIKVGATTKEPAQKLPDPAPSQTKPIAPPQPFPSDQPSYFQGLGTSVATPYGAPLSHANTPAKPANQPQPMPAPIAKSEDLKSVIVVNKSESPEKLFWRQRIAAALWDYLDVLVTGQTGTDEFEELRTLLNESPLDEAEKQAEFQSQIEKLKERPFKDKAAMHAGAHELHMNGLHLNKRLEILVAGLLLKELGPEIEQDLANTFVLATMSGTKKEIEDAAKHLDRYCFDSENRDGQNSMAKVKRDITKILERDLNERSLDDTQKASLLKRLPSETKPFSIPILRTLLEKATPAKPAKQPQPTNPAPMVASENLESIIVVNKSEPRQPTLDHRGEAAVESFVDALIAGDDPETLAFAFFGPKEPPDKTKLRHMMDEVYNQVKGNHTLYGNAVFAWSKHVLAGRGPEKLSLALKRLELIQTDSGYFSDFRVAMRQVVNELLRQRKTDLTESVKLLSTDPEKAANLMVAWAERYQKSGLKADDKEFNISGLVVAALYGTDVVEVIRLRERFTLLLRGGPLSKMNTEISSVVADALRQAEASKARDSDAETQKNIGAARFIRAVLTGEQGIEQMYPFEEKHLDNILKGRSPDELRDLRNAVENYKGPQLRPANGLEMLNRSLQAYEWKAIEEKYLLNKPLV